MNEALALAMRRSSFARNLPVKQKGPDIQLIRNPPRPGPVPPGKVDWRRLCREYEEQHRLPLIAVAEIVRAVSGVFMVSPQDLFSPRRDTYTVKARRVAYYLSRRLTIHTYKDIGQLFGDGGRDHSTILAGIAKIIRQMDADPELKDRVYQLEREIIQWAKAGGASEATSA